MEWSAYQITLKISKFCYLKITRIRRSHITGSTHHIINSPYRSLHWKIERTAIIISVLTRQCFCVWFYRGEIYIFYYCVFNIVWRALDWECFWAPFRASLSVCVCERERVCVWVWWVCVCIWVCGSDSVCVCVCVFECFRGTTWKRIIQQ